METQYVNYESLKYCFKENNDEKDDERKNGAIDDENNDIPDIAQINCENFVRHPRIPAHIIEIDFLPEPNEWSRKISELFVNMNDNNQYCDILYYMKINGLEKSRFDITKIINKCLIDNIIHNEKWISMFFIGISDMAVSSKGRIFRISNRKVVESTKNRSFVSFDNKHCRYISKHSLICSAFYSFPTELHMTVDHNNQNYYDDSAENLSFENKVTQTKNRKYEKRIKIPIVKYNIEGIIVTIIPSIEDAISLLSLEYGKIKELCETGNIYDNYRLSYMPAMLLPGEFFRNIPVEGLESYKISNMGRFMSSSENKIKIGCPTRYKYLHASFVNTKYNKTKRYMIHILVAITFVNNPNPDKYNIVNHIDSNRTNPIATNLEWTNKEGNAIHASQQGKLCQKAVICKYKDGRILKYNSISEASRGSGISIKIISKHCHEKILDMDPVFEFDERCEVGNYVKAGNGIPIAQLDLSTRKILFIWQSSYVADKYTKIKFGSISSCILGNSTHAGGFYWKRVTIDEQPWSLTLLTEELLRTLRNKKFEKIYHMNSQTGNIINIYENEDDAVTKLNISKKKIKLFCTLHEDERYYLLYESEYRKRVESKISIINNIDYNNTPIIIMNINGDLLFEVENIQIAASRISKITGGKLSANNVKILCNSMDTYWKEYRFAFKYDYEQKPELYKILSTKLLNVLKKNNKNNINSDNNIDIFTQNISKIIDIDMKFVTEAVNNIISKNMVITNDNHQSEEKKFPKTTETELRKMNMQQLIEKFKELGYKHSRLRKEQLIKVWLENQETSNTITIPSNIISIQSTLDTRESKQNNIIIPSFIFNNMTIFSPPTE